MNGKKATARPVKKGLLPKLKGLLDGLSDRYHRVLQVIDEALASENLKDKIWAVDLILKRTPTPEPVPDKPKIDPQNSQRLDPIALDQLSDAELLARIRQHLKGTEIE